MSATTGPVLAAGAITVANLVVFNEEDMDWRIPVATTMLAGGLYLVERIAGDMAEVLAWTLLVTTLFTRFDPSVPSPVESAVRWWDGNQKGPGTPGTRFV
jgi:hypothetical protein